MKNFLVIGNPIEHSLSPEMFEWIFEVLDINAQYKKKCIDIRGIEGVINHIREGELNGLNVTLPYKESVIRLNFSAVIGRGIKAKGNRGRLRTV